MQFFDRGGLMELQEVVLGRRSIRQFLPKPVPEEMIQDLIDESRWSPSWGNTQPWEIVVGTGKSLSEFKKKNRAAFLEGQASTTDIPMPQIWPDHNKLRYKELGKSVLGPWRLPEKTSRPAWTILPGCSLFLMRPRWLFLA